MASIPLSRLKTDDLAVTYALFLKWLNKPTLHCVNIHNLFDDCLLINDNNYKDDTVSLFDFLNKFLPLIGDHHTNNIIKSIIINNDSDSDNDTIDNYAVSKNINDYLLQYLESMNNNTNTNTSAKFCILTEYILGCLTCSLYEYLLKRERGNSTIAASIVTLLNFSRDSFCFVLQLFYEYEHIHKIEIDFGKLLKLKIYDFLVNYLKYNSSSLYTNEYFRLRNEINKCYEDCITSYLLLVPTNDNFNQELIKIESVLTDFKYTDWFGALIYNDLLLKYGFDVDQSTTILASSLNYIDIFCVYKDIRKNLREFINNNIICLAYYYYQNAILLLDILETSKTKTKIKINQCVSSRIINIIIYYLTLSKFLLAKYKRQNKQKRCHYTVKHFQCYLNENLMLALSLSKNIQHFTQYLHYLHKHYNKLKIKVFKIINNHHTNNNTNNNMDILLSCVVEFFFLAEKLAMLYFLDRRLPKNMDLCKPYFDICILLFEKILYPKINNNNNNNKNITIIPTTTINEIYAKMVKLYLNNIHLKSFDKTECEKTYNSAVKLNVVHYQHIVSLLQFNEFWENKKYLRMINKKKWYDLKKMFIF